MCNVRLAVCALMFSILTGCASFSPEQADPPKTMALRTDAATIYLYRLVEGAGIRHGSVDISVDGKDVVSLKNGGCTAFYLPSGIYEFRASWPLMDKPLFEGDAFEPKSLFIALEPEKSYYINYEVMDDGKRATFLESQFLLGKMLSKSHILYAELRVNDKVMGEYRLKQCRYQPNKLYSSS